MIRADIYYVLGCFFFKLLILAIWGVKQKIII